MTRNEFTEKKKEIYEKWKLKNTRLNTIKVELVKREVLNDSEMNFFNNQIEEYKILLIETTKLVKELEDLCELWQKGE